MTRIPLSSLPARYQEQAVASLHPKAPPRPIPPAVEGFLAARGIVASPFDSAVREFRFHPTRKFRADFAWLDKKVIMEVDGGLHVQGGHSRGAAREYDMARDAEAMMLGWKVVRVSTKQFKNGDADRWLGVILGL